MRLDDSWMEQALCRELPLVTRNEWFFPDRGASSNPAKKVCSECPVRQECLDYAMSNVERWGVWGGYSERQRREMRRTYQIRRSCTVCSSEFRCLASSRQKFCSDACRTKAHLWVLERDRILEAPGRKCAHCGAAASHGSMPPSCSDYCSKVIHKLHRRPPILWDEVS